MKQEDIEKEDRFLKNKQLKNLMISSISWLKCLIPAEQKKTKNKYF